MKKTLLLSTLLISIVVLTTSLNNATPVGTEFAEIEFAPALDWHTDLATAMEKSKKTKKPIFAFFTGSDWCGWCTRLKTNVFAKEDFKTWADKSVILLELDFPRRKKLPAKLAQQNQQLQQLFKVRGYPTVWIFDTSVDPKTKQANINAWGSLSYPRAQAGQESAKFIADANAILATKK